MSKRTIISDYAPDSTVMECDECSKSVNVDSDEDYTYGNWVELDKEDLHICPDCLAKLVKRDLFLAGQ